ncbi:aminopeptidase N-like protein, partial [Leptotrombidium deliense]
RQPWILNRYLDWAFNESSRIRKQDGSSVFRSVAGNNFGRDLAFSYLRDKWDAIVDYYGKSFFSFGNLVKGVSSSFNTKFELQQLRQFYSEKKGNLGSAERSFKQSVENTEANVEWMQRNYGEIQTWILKQSKNLKNR